MKIDWFEIDMEAFQTLYDEYVQAVDAHFHAEKAFAACQDAVCGHNRRLRKDGRPDGRAKCPQEGNAYQELTDTGNRVMYAYGTFFKSIGLEYDPRQLVDHG